MAEAPLPAAALAADSEQILEMQGMRLAWDEGRGTEGGGGRGTAGAAGGGEAARGRRRVRQAVSGPGGEQSLGDWGQTQAAGADVTRGAGGP